MKTILLAYLVTLLSVALSWAEEGTSQVRAFRTTEGIKIDGRLKEGAWSNPGISGFIQKNPNEGQPATQKTEVWVAYDDEALYVAARMWDTAPDSIVGRIGRRDAGLNCDAFVVYIDSYHDKRTGFYFWINPLGSVGDGTLSNDSWSDDTWDGVWEGAARIDGKGWTAEFRIPYSQLRFSRKTRYVWGINFNRYIERYNESDYLVMVPKKDSGFVSHFADLVGIEGINPPRRLDLLPYLVTSGKFLQHEAGDPFHKGFEFYKNLGANLKLGLGPNLTLDATINPDFGQVEVDPAVVNLSAYETYYEEKRPFFIEGMDIFSFGQRGSNSNWGFNSAVPQFFYSRRIGRPPQGSVTHTGFMDLPVNTTILGAAKISGKLPGGWEVGTIHALTAREFADIDTAGVRFKQEVEPLTYYGVIRTFKDLNQNRQGIGFMGTAVVRNFSDDSLKNEMGKAAVALGIDGYTFLDRGKTWVINGWLGGSEVWGERNFIAALQEAPQRYYQRPDIHCAHLDSNRTSLSGWAGRVSLNRQKGNFYLNSALGVNSPGFETNDLGFHWRSNLINHHLVLGYRWFQPGKVFRQKFVNLIAARNWDFDGNKTSEVYMLFLNGQLVNYWGFNCGFGVNPSTLSNEETRGGPLMRSPGGYFGNFFIYSDSRKPVVLNFFGSYHSSPSGGRSYYFRPGIEWKPASFLTLELNPEYQWAHSTASWVVAQPDPTATATYGSRYVFSALEQRELSASLRMNWTFTPKLSLQLYMQPLLASGDYSDFKELARPKSYEFNHYGSTIEYANGAYTVDPDGPGPAESFSFRDPDFNYKSLRGTVVLRWEFLPGSTIYLVWTEDREDHRDPGEFHPGRDLFHLLTARPNNIFLFKLAYWWNL